MSDTVIDSCRCASRSHDTFQSSCLISTNLHRIQARLARIIQEYRREAAETEAWRGFSQVRATQADLRSVEETEREKPRQAMESAAVAGIHELSGLAHRTPFNWTVPGDTAAALNARQVHESHAVAFVYGSAHALQIVLRIGRLF